MFTTGYRSTVRARHALRGVSGPEAEDHTHEYRVEWICSVGRLDDNGYGLDISLMRNLLIEELGKIDDVFLNDLEYFQNRQPSLENLAMYLYAQLKDRLIMSGTLSTPETMEIIIHENMDAWASFRHTFVL